MKGKEKKGKEKKRKKGKKNKRKEKEKRKGKEKKRKKEKKGKEKKKEKKRADFIQVCQFPQSLHRSQFQYEHAVSDHTFLDQIVPPSPHTISESL